MTTSDIEEFHLTEKQNEATSLLGGIATHNMLYGGSRSGKTFVLCRAIAVRALKGPGSRHGIFRLRFNDVKQSVWLDTFPKMMRLCFPDVPYRPDKSNFYYEFPGGSEVWIGGLDDNERVEKILGKEYVTIMLNECSQISLTTVELVKTRLAQKIDNLKPKMYYDENPPLRTHWSYRQFEAKRKPEPPYAPLDDARDYASLYMHPLDNAENLTETYLKTLQSLSPRAKLRFWDGVFGDAVENALWTYEVIEKYRVTHAPDDMLRIVVAVDPSGTKGEEGTRSDEVGIVVVGLGLDGHAYILEDVTVNAPPAVWGRIVVQAFERHDADAVVGEVNYGGAMVEHVVQTAARAEDLTVPYKEVRATRGKVIRAEPVSALYEQGKVHHVGNLPALEDQLVGMTTAGYMGERSPDRADAGIWGIYEIFPGLIRKDRKKKARAAPRRPRSAWAS